MPNYILGHSGGCDRGHQGPRRRRNVDGVLRGPAHDSGSDGHRGRALGRRVPVVDGHQNGAAGSHQVKILQGKFLNKQFGEKMAANRR